MIDELRKETKDPNEFLAKLSVCTSNSTEFFRNLSSTFKECLQESELYFHFLYTHYDSQKCKQSCRKYPKYYPCKEVGIS